MIKKLNLILIALLFLKIEVSAQKTPEKLLTFKYGKVNPEEFETKAHGADSAAAAVKLFEVGNAHFEVGPSGTFVYVLERHVRYKIINKQAYDLANVEVRLYRDGQGSEEKMDFINGATYNLKDGKVETSKMNNDAKFTSRLDDKHIVKKFTLPNIKEGSIIEYRYRTKSDFTFRLDDWYFQDRYPTRYSSFSIIVPDYYIYKINAGGYININQLKPISSTSNYSIPNATSRTENVSISTVESQYYVEDAPAIKSESYITTLYDYISKIGFELNATNFPNTGYKAYTSTWPKIVKEMMDHESFGGFIRKNSASKALVKEIIKQETDPEAKTNLIFNYVKNNLKWDNKYRVYTEASNQKAILEKKSGNSAEINLVLLGLLDAAGLECYPVLVSTRENGTHPGYPLATKFNSVIVMAGNGEKKYLLDAVDKNNVKDLLSYENLNHKGLKIDRTAVDGEWVSTDNTLASKTSVFYNLVLDKENKLKGTLSVSKNNYDAVETRNSYQTATNEEEFLKGYKLNKPGLEISNFKIDNVNNPDEALIESMDVTIEDNIETAGNLSYFTPLLFERVKQNPFSLEERNFPVDFAHPNEHSYRLSIEFPEDYKLDQIPKNERFKLPDDGGTFSILYTVEGNRLNMVSKISILKTTYSPDEYYNLKELYKNIVRKQAEQIVFKKS
ncbi:transglutaminase domain-containing protein [Pedobacter cryoconitis]|uniref:Transglutaminase superfamily protein n=1 Tax=Pedobacter cryoconitis TaxID=188932 RepID=A0A7X0J735_9SPHI|nr:DUF3857 domain-containing protein [Pedobacter cryoconitis]MBB6501849.1 hypothetical protein [Pedobacter cryoconitis]